MNGWIILGIVILCLFLLTLIRLGAEVTYSDQGLRVRVRAGKIWITLIPRKPKKAKKPKSEKSPKKKRKKPKEKAEDEKPQPRHRGGLPVPLTELISMAVDAVGMVLSRLQIDTMELEYLIGGKSDPAGAAMLYGGLYAGGGSIVPLLENTFYCIRKREIRAWIDYQSDQSLVWLQLALSIRLGQILSIGLCLGWRFLRAYLKHRKENESLQEGTNHGTKASNQ